MAAALIFGALNRLLTSGSDQLPPFVPVVFGGDQEGEFFKEEADYLTTTVAPEIEQFTPVDEEQRYIIGELMIWAAETVQQEFASALLRVTQGQREQYLRNIGKLP